MFLLADTEVVEQSSGLFPQYFWVMILALVIIFIIACILQLVGWRVIDWITPGNLAKELLGERSDGKPNVALAIVVAAMFLGLAIVLTGTIIGVLGH